MISDLTELPVIYSHKQTITDYKDIIQYPDYESYLIDYYDINYNNDTFPELFNNIFYNPTWEDSRLYYLLQAYKDLLQNDVVVEVNRINDFFDVFMLKQVTTAQIDSETDPIQKDLLTRYYERFYEIFNNYVNYLKPYLDTIENNEEIQNNLKKDLLIYFGKQIYSGRGRQSGYTFLKNILNPLTVVNNLTGETAKYQFEINFLEWGSFTLNASDLTKAPFIYYLQLQNLNNSTLKISVIDILKYLIHPAGYKYYISDYTTFEINIVANTFMINYSEKYNTGDGIYREFNISPEPLIWLGGILGYGVNWRSQEGIELRADMSFGTPFVDYEV